MVDFIKDYEKVEASQGFTNEPMKKGQYPLVVKAVETSTHDEGYPVARLQLQVTQGPTKGRVVFKTFYFGANKVKGIYENNQKTGEVVRTEEEYEKAAKGAIGAVKGFLKAIELTTGTPTGDTENEAILSFYRVSEWQGRTFMGNVGIDRNRPDQNSLDGYHSNNDPKVGLNNWEQKVLPKLMGVGSAVVAGERL